MPNPQKQRGTRFESAVVWYLQEHTEGVTVERQALAGANDKGDIKLQLAGLTGIIECKYRKGGLHTPKELEEYKRQTIAEEVNANADISALVVNDRSGSCSKGSASVGANKCYIYFPNLLQLAVPIYGFELAASWLFDLWVCITLKDFARCLNNYRSL